MIDEKWKKLKGKQDCLIKKTIYKTWITAAHDFQLNRNGESFTSYCLRKANEVLLTKK